jgi:hemolysin activation/secretion protein
MDSVRNDLVLCQGTLASSEYFGVLLSRGWAGRLAPVKSCLIHVEADTEMLVPFVFLDLGAGRNHLDPIGIPRSWLEMVSAGPGLTGQFTPYAALRLNWGFPLVRNGQTGALLGPQFGTQVTF